VGVSKLLAPWRQVRRQGPFLFATIARHSIGKALLQVLTANLTAKALHTGVQKAKNWTGQCTK
jgi:hypothetical protein